MKYPVTHVERFIEQLGTLAEGEGLPRTAGRMMGLLIMSGAPLGIDQLALSLKVSRASVSTNSRLLQSLGIAQLVREPGNRRDYLQISGCPSSSLLTIGLRRMESMRVAIQEMGLVLKVQRVLHRWRQSESNLGTAIAAQAGERSSNRDTSRRKRRVS